jgi:hypothetical protein
LCAGAENIQLLSFIMGKTNISFQKKNGTKFDKVFHKLILDPEDGLLRFTVKEKLGKTDEDFIL